MNPFSNANQVLDKPKSSTSNDAENQMNLFPQTETVEERPTEPSAAPFTPTEGSSAPFTPTEGSVAEQNTESVQTTPPPPVGQTDSPFGTPAGQNQFFGGGSSGTQQSPKYNIIDLFWLINQKLIDKTQIQPNEAHLLTIGYNASFGNLRMTFYGCNQNTFTPSSIILGNAKRITTANMYPEACIELLSKKDANQPIMLFERTIRNDNKWSPNQTTVIWAKNAIRIQTTDSQNVSSLFDITNWQVIAFEQAMLFMTRGKSWDMNMHSVFHK